MGGFPRIFGPKWPNQSRTEPLLDHLICASKNVQTKTGSSVDHHLVLYLANSPHGSRHSPSAACSAYVHLPSTCWNQVSDDQTKCGVWWGAVTKPTLIWKNRVLRCLLHNYHWHVRLNEPVWRIILLFLQLNSTFLRNSLPRNLPLRWYYITKCFTLQIIAAINTPKSHKLSE